MPSAGIMASCMRKISLKLRTRSSGALPHLIRRNEYDCRLVSDSGVTSCLSDGALGKRRLQVQSLAVRRMLNFLPRKQYLACLATYSQQKSQELPVLRLSPEIAKTTFSVLDRPLLQSNFLNPHLSIPQSALKPFVSTSDDIILWQGAGSEDVVEMREYSHPVVLSSEGSVLSKASDGSSSPQPSDPLGPPSTEQLIRVQDVLTNTLPKLFIQPLDYKIYNPNIEFINNIRGTRSVGIISYVRQVAFLRAAGHFKFAYVSFNILKITRHPDEGSIKVRWRIAGVPAWRIMTRFWSIKLWKYKETLDEHKDTWYDGFSTFYVAGDGLIYRHVADKMMPDEEFKTVSKADMSLAAKLALVFGILQHPEVGDMAPTFLQKLDKKQWAKVLSSGKLA